MLITYLETKHVSIKITPIAKTVLFVYFIHVIVIGLVWRIYGSYLYSLTAGHIVSTLWFTPTISIVTTLISFTIAFIARKIHFVRALLRIEK